MRQPADCYIFEREQINAIPFFFSTGRPGYSCTENGWSQGYIDSIKAFRADYVQTNELLTTKEQKALLRFYPLDPAYRVVARFEKYADSPWFQCRDIRRNTPDST